MSLAAAPVRPLTIQQWYDLFHDYEGGRCELVRGHAIMTPTEAFRNINACRRLERCLEDALGPAWMVYRHASVTTESGATPTVRVPDLMIARGDMDPNGWRANPADVSLVAEVVSPGSVETDWVTKRAEYAAAGIANYLIVDVRLPEGPQLWLFDRVLAGVPGGPTTYPRYADPTGDGTSVTIRIPDCDPITVTAADLA